MSESKQEVIDGGEAVMRAMGELSATAKDAAKAAADTNVDHEEVQGWLATIFKAILEAIKH